MIVELVNRIKNKILYKFLKSESDLYNRYNQFASLPNLIREHKEKFDNTFNHYVTEISVDSMAISLELAVTLYSLCLLKKPKAILDLGSGYSSFVFRYYQKHNNTECLVYSIDDNAEWLIKTKEYLLSKEVSIDGVFHIDEIEKLKGVKFDIILHDMNYVEIRKNYLDLVFDLLGKDGIVLLDDIHKPDYLKACIAKIKQRQWNFYGMQNTTTDKFKRFSVMAINSIS